jgi:tetratricopeptide (TPR) repeat protein
MIEIPASLTERIKARQAILVTGLGCSRLAGLPGWEDLGRRLADWIEHTEDRARVGALLDAGRIATALAYLRARLPDAVVVEVLKDAYPPQPAVPEPIAMLARIPWRGVITTAYDDLWDRALLGDDASPTQAFLPAAAEALERHRGRFLLHLFGSVAAPDSICLSPQDLRERLTPTGMIEVVDDLYRKRSFVFVGFGPDDPDLRMVTQRLLGANVNHVEHFLLYAGSGDGGFEAELIRIEVGLTPVAADGGLETAVEALGQAWSSVADGARPPETDLEAWLEIWSREPADEEAQAVLGRAEQRLRVEKEWDRLVDLLLGQVEHLPGRREQAAMLREVGRIYESELDAPDRAYAALSTAFSLDPDDLALGQDLLRVAGRSNRWSELVTEYVEIVKDVTDPAARARHALEIARIHAEELNQYDAALVEYQRVLDLEVEPGAGDFYATALSAMGDLLSKQERWGDLAAALAAAAEREKDPGRELALRLQLADLQGTRLGDADAALASYERAYAIDPTRVATEEALERLYRSRERWPDLLRLLEQKGKRSDDPLAAAELRKQRAELLERIGDIDASIVALEAVVSGDPRNRAALRSLEKLYDKQGRDADYLRTLERLCDVAESDAERLMLLRRLAAEWDERPDGVDRAAEALEQILQIDPRDDDAFRALGRVYRQARRWSPLVEAFNRKIGVTGDAPGIRELHVQLARLHDEELNDADRALDAYAAADRLGDERASTLEALARLAEGQGRWRQAAEALNKLGKAAREPAERAAALLRAGSLLAERLDDKAAAEDCYARALELEPGNAGALEALGALYRARGEYLRATKLLLEAGEATQNRIEKVRLLSEAAVLYQDRLDDLPRATEIFTRVLAVDPEHQTAAERLVPLFTADARWAELEPVLDMLARKEGAAPAASDDRSGGGDAEHGEQDGEEDGEGAARAADLQSRLAFVAHKLGNLEKAARGYQLAYRLAPRSLPVLAGFADLRLEQQEWAEASALYQSIVTHHQQSLPEEELVDVYVRLGRCATGAGDRQAALGWYEKASALAGLHRPALEGIAALHAEMGDFAALVLDKRALLTLTDEAGRVRLWEELADIYRDKLDDLPQAIAAHQAVLGLQPGRRQTLHTLLELHSEAKQWPQAADTLVRLADLEADRDVRAKYLYTAALIRRDELGDGEGAVALLNRSLDESASLIRSFEAIERILTEAQSWKELARNYRRMIKRLPAEGLERELDELRLRLWSGLGEVSLRHLDDREMATTAFEVASSLDPSNLQRREQLAELYVQAGPAGIDKAIEQHQLLLAKNPDRLASYRALARLYGEAQMADKRWCVAATLSFLRKADPELMAVYEQHRPRELRTAKRRFTDDLWQKVIHPDEDRFVGAVFMLLGHFVAATAAQQHPAVGLRRKERVDTSHDARMPMRILRYVAQTLELPEPDVFYRDADPHTVSLLNLQEKGVLTPAFVIGREIVERATEPEMVFEMGKRMAFLRPERFLRCAVPSVSALDIALRSALALAGSGIGAGIHNGEVDRLTDQLRRLVPRPVAEQLAVVGRQLLEARGEVIDMEAWVAATDLSAARVGFVLSNELPSAARVISSESSAQSPLGAKQRLKDLLSYSVSEDYFAVRKFLGLAVM